MNLSYFAYIVDSNDEKYPATKVVKTEYAMLKGEKNTIITPIGDYDIIGMGAIEYESEDDVVKQVNGILKEMGI